jgi:hypothetical protein
MGYILNEPKTFINIKLTDVGRRQLSLGNLRFISAVFSDREINYGIDRNEDFYNIENNRILSPVDVEPNFSINFDGTNAIPLQGNQIVSAKQFSTGSTDSYGFFSGITNLSGNTFFDISKVLGINTITYSASSINGGNVVTLDNNIPFNYFPNTGELVFIPWEPIQNSGQTYMNTTIDIDNPTVSLWYRVIDTNITGDTITLDRPIPNFGGTSTPQVINTYFYPFNGIETFYGTAATVDPQVWNMNIVRTQSVIGTSLNLDNYKKYGSIEYNGTKTYLGFTNSVEALGIVHYTNEFTGNTYAEQFLEKTVRIDLPYIMWHNIPVDNGQGLNYGLTLFDSFGDTKIDSAANSTFRDLRDGVSENSIIVGRIYHKLKLIVITDPELLTAITYRSNRNYTLPPLQLNLSSVPKFPLNTTQATGLCKEEKSYFVTYVTESFSSYTQDVSFGYPKTLHCGYIQRIDGATDNFGNIQYLSATFPTNTFPYLRNSANMSANSPFSGTGWNANKVQLLVSEQNFNPDLQISDVPAQSWKLISTTVGNGIYTGDTTDLTIDPNKLNGYQFIISQEDYDSGSTYVLDTVFTNNNDFSTTGLTFGNESFLFGNVKVDVLATTYKTVITAFAENNSHNSSTNLTYDDNFDSDTYITEVGILDSDNNLVAVGKPTYPIKKNEGRYLTFQLQIDF